MYRKPRVPNSGLCPRSLSEGLEKQMSQQSTYIWSDAPVVIDAANVASSADLKGCGKCCWDRVDAVRQAWREQIDSNATFVLVMDASKANQLGSECKRAYRKERAEKAVLEVDFADPEILRIAEEKDAAVISRDGFKDRRREFPWIDGNRDQFFEWGIHKGKVAIIARDMFIPSDFSKTRAEERAELKGLGADIKKPEVERALRQVFRCDTESCWLHKYDPGHYTGVPDLQIPQQPRCKVCGQVLTVLGEAPRLVQLKFSNSARTKTERLTLAPGSSLIVGRESEKRLVLGVLDSDINLISHQHVRIEWDGSNLLITDLGSKNGSTLRRWAGKLHGYDKISPLEGAVKLLARDEVCLARTLLITRSARSFTLEHEPETSTLPPVVQDSPTIMIDGQGS